MSDTTLPSHLKPRASVVSVNHGDDMVLLNVATGRYYTLNRTGAQVWQWLCDGMSTEALIRHLAETYAMSGDVAATDVSRLLVDCAAASLFENS